MIALPINCRSQGKRASPVTDLTAWRALQRATLGVANEIARLALVFSCVLKGANVHVHTTLSYTFHAVGIHGGDSPHSDCLCWQLDRRKHREGVWQRQNRSAPGERIF